ncbi:hypothetical protein AKO1_006834 [Acrasis kona]|uniref:Uncharacterized protein n=1 Tax=Acrasis kona TaxID=1008807 RepID=A0AAW2YTX0_9EUKA
MVRSPNLSRQCHLPNFEMDAMNITKETAQRLYEEKCLHNSNALNDNILLVRKEALVKSLFISFGMQPCSLRREVPEGKKVYVISILTGPTKDYHVMIVGENSFINYQKVLGDWSQEFYPEEVTFEHILATPPSKFSQLECLKEIIKQFPILVGNFEVMMDDGNTLGCNCLGMALFINTKVRNPADTKFNQLKKVHHLLN